MNRLTRSDMAHFSPQTQVSIDDGQTTTLTTYDGNSQVIGIEDDNGHTITTAYDTAGRVAMKTDATGLSSPTPMMPMAMPRQSPVRISRESAVMAYDDPLNRQVGSVDPLTFTSQAGYDSRNNLVTTVDARGNQVHYAYDGLNRLIQTTRNLTNTGDGGGTSVGTITTLQSWTIRPASQARPMPTPMPRVTPMTRSIAASRKYLPTAPRMRIPTTCTATRSPAPMPTEPS